MSDPLPEQAADPQQTNEMRGLETPSVAPSIPHGFRGVIQNRAFLSLWAAQVASQTAQNTLWFVLIVLVSQLTGQSTLSTGITIILVQLPTVLFSGVSGVFVDRLPKRSILIGTNVIRVGGVLLYILFQHDVGLLYLITFLIAIVSQPFAPAEGSTIPLLVKGQQLISANSLFQLTFMGSQAVGFAVAPIALGFLGTRVTLIMLAAMFAFAAVVLIGLPASTRKHVSWGKLGAVEIGRRVIAELMEAFQFVVHDPPLAIALVQIALAPTLLLVLAEVGPNFLASLHLGNTGTALFFLLAPAGLGLGIGLFVLGHFGTRLRQERLVLIALIALGISVIGLASVPTLALFWQAIQNLGIDVPQGVRITLTIVPITALMGLEVAFINAPVQTIVQERATGEFRGRVLGFQQTVTAGMAIPPLIVVGGIAAVFGTPATLALMGVVLVLVGLGGVYYS